MYKIINSIVAIVIVGAISTQMCGMEEKQREKGQEKRVADPAALLADDTAKRQRVAQELQARGAAAVSNAPERQTIKVEREDETEMPMQPVITNSHILEVLTGFGALLDTRMDRLEAMIAEIQRSLPPRPMPAPAAKAPFPPGPKQASEQAGLAIPARLDRAGSELSSGAQASQPGLVPMLPLHLLQAQQQVPSMQARLANAIPAMSSYGAPAPQQAASAKLSPQLLQAGQASQSAQSLIPPQNHVSTQQRSCTYTETHDFVAHEGGAVNFVHQVNGTTFSSSSDSFRFSDKDGASQGLVRYPCLASCVAFYKPITGLAHLCIGSIEDYTVKDMPDSVCGFKTYAGHTGRVNCIIPWHSLDGQTHILSASADNTIKLWDLEISSLIRTISGHAGSVNVLRVTRQWGKPHLVSGSADKSIKIWDRDGRLLRTILGHEGSVTCLDDIDAGLMRQFIVSGSGDGTVRLWDQEGQNLNTIVHGDAVHSVKCCHCGPQQELIVSASQSKINLWLVKLNEGRVKTYSVQNLHTINATNDVMQQNNLSDDKVKISAMDLIVKIPSAEFILTYGTHGGRIKKGVIKIS